MDEGRFVPADPFRFPTGLDARTDAALREAVSWVAGRYESLGIFACGSLLRGEGGPTSDLDLYVIHGQPWRQRVQRRFAGVPAEIFVNSPTSARGYLAEEARGGRPLTAHMLATGHV